MGQPLRSSWRPQLPKWMRPDKSLCNRVLRGASSQAHLRTVGHQHSQLPSYHPALEDSRPSDAQTAEVRLDSKPPRTPTIQSHKAQGAPPGARGTSHFPAALGRAWAGAGAPRSPRCFSWEVLNLFLLTQPWGLSGRVLPNLRYVLEGCLVGPPSRQWWGSPLRTQSVPPEPQPVLCPRWGLSSDGGSQGTAPAWWRLRSAAHTPASLLLRVGRRMSSQPSQGPPGALLSPSRLPLVKVPVSWVVWGEFTWLPLLRPGTGTGPGPDRQTDRCAPVCSHVMSLCRPMGTVMLDCA